MPRSIWIAALVALTACGQATAQPTGTNGVGTAGSLDRNAGSASSTTAGQQRAGQPVKPQGGAGGTMESDPSLGGDKKPDQ